MYHSAIYLLAALYHESGRDNTLAHTVGQAQPFTEFADLSEDAMRGRVLTASMLLDRFSIAPRTAKRTPNSDEVESLARAIHKCEQPIQHGWVFPRPWIAFDFDELPAQAREGRRGQARYLLGRVTFLASAGNKPRARATAPSAAGRQTAEDFARASLREESITDPSTPLLRARLMLDFAREARDLAPMLGIGTIRLASFDDAEGMARNAYRQLLNIERADGDRLAASAPPAELVVLLRRAQAERDQLVAENLKLESRLTIAEVAIHTAQEENRAPIWPPACDAAPAPSN